MGFKKNAPGCGCGCGTTPPSGVNIPGCVCQGAPTTVNLTYNRNTAVGSDPGVAFIPGNGPLTYYDAAPGPSYLAGSTFPGRGYYSALWYSGDTPSYFRISCSSNQYILWEGNKFGAIWQAPYSVCTWGIGPPNQVNFCSPFGLYVSQPIPNGPVYYGNFVATG